MTEQLTTLLLTQSLTNTTVHSACSLHNSSTSLPPALHTHASCYCTF